MSERAQFWLSHLSAIETEGITTKAYAEREGLPASALYSWRKRLSAGGRASRSRGGGGFVAIELEAAAPSVGCTVVIDAHLHLEWRTLPSVDWLAALSTALRALGR